MKEDNNLSDDFWEPLQKVKMHCMCGKCAGLMLVN